MHYTGDSDTIVVAALLASKLYTIHPSYSTAHIALDYIDALLLIVSSLSRLGIRIELNV